MRKYKTKNNLASLSDNCDKSTQYNESDIEDENDIENKNDIENDTIEQSDNKSWFSW